MKGTYVEGAVGIILSFWHVYMVQIPLYTTELVDRSSDLLPIVKAKKHRISSEYFNANIENDAGVWKAAW